MKEYKFTVLFKNGIQLTVVEETEKDDIMNIKQTIKGCYQNGCAGYLYLYGNIINVSDTSYISIVENI